MSFCVGHTLAALSIYNATEKPSSSTTSHEKKYWLCWLVFVASVPDIDYITNFPNYSVRYTHSIFACLVVPLLSIIMLKLLKYQGELLFRRSLQVVLVGLSHLVLDLLVGVKSLPLFWLLTNDVFSLPFGILPSAGKLSFHNYYFYRNLFIEIGVLAPLCYLSYRRKNALFWIATSLCFMILAFQLGRG